MTRAPRARKALAIIFGLFSANAWAQVLFSQDPPMLAALQVAIGVAGAFAARGSWIGARWAPAAALAYGSVTAAMLIALPVILRLEPEARPGIWSGAAAVFVLSALSAWYLRRVIRRDATPPRSSPHA